VKEAGVTLLELLATLAIVLILASVAMPVTKVAMTRERELELRQALRTVRGAIDAFKADWNRDGDVLLGPLCLKNKLTCKEVSSLYGYPKSLNMLLSITLTGEEATARGATIKRYLRSMPVDPMTGKNDWIVRCYADQPNTTSWCGVDVFDIGTQSEGVALNGTSYRDW
jgi:general secretion pathway protein G